MAPLPNSQFLYYRIENNYIISKIIFFLILKI